MIEKIKKVWKDPVWSAVIVFIITSIFSIRLCIILLILCVIFQTNEFLTDATFTGSQGPFWWILQMCMALAALFAIVMAAGMAYKMMVKHEPLDVMKLFRPLAVSLVLCWWYPPADTGMAGSGSNWCVLDFLSYIPNCIGSYTHDLYEAEAAQISDRFSSCLTASI